MTSGARIAVNTLAQYIKTFVNILLGFYSTRIVLEALGESDYGVYMLIAGVVGMLSFFNIALSVTTQRFLSYHQNDIERKTIIFVNSLIIHVGASMLILIALEFCGLFMFDGFLNIPSDRLEVAKIIFHCAIMMIALSVITSPFRAVLISRENIVFVSFIDVIDGVLKVLIAIYITHLTSDRLLQFSFLTLGIYVFTFLSFLIFDFIRYPECTFPKSSDIEKPILKKLSTFAGWSLFSSGCIIGRNQGVSIVLNIFFGTILNAAYAISVQISGAVNYIGSALQTAYSPRIIMKEGKGERDEMLYHCSVLSRISLLVMALLGIPIIACIPEILSFWLKNVPEDSALLCRVIIVAAIFDQLSSGLIVANRAIGKLRLYSLTVDSIKLLTVVAFAVLLLLKVQFVIAIWVYALCELFSAISRLFVLRANAGLEIKWWIKTVIFRSFIPIFVLSVAWYWIGLREFNLFEFVVEFIAVALVFTGLCYVFGATSNEKMIIKDKLTRILCHN